MLAIMRQSASREQWRNGNIVVAIIMNKWQPYMDQQVTKRVHDILLWSLVYYIL